MQNTAVRKLTFVTSLSINNKCNIVMETGLKLQRNAYKYLVLILHQVKTNWTS